MRRPLAMLVLVTLALAGASLAAEGDFRVAQPGYAFRFPRDHGNHPEFQTEWWYYTGHLRTEAGRRFGFEMTFFRFDVRRRRPGEKSAWALTSLYMSHLALSDELGKRFIHRQIVGRPALGMAGAETERYRVWVYDWSARLDAQGRHRLHAATRDAVLSRGGRDEAAPPVSLDLSLTSRKPPVVHGERGVLRKSGSAASQSHYYSLTRLVGDGTLRLGDQTFRVDATAWMDHEFFTRGLAPDQIGWDWFAVQLDNQTELMFYLMRRQDGSIESVSSGTLVLPDGRTRRLPLSAVQIRSLSTWRSSISGAVYPSGWAIAVPSQQLDLRLTPVLRDQETRGAGPFGITYWEGAVDVRGKSAGKAIRGQGYVELTGYAGKVPGL